MTNQKKPTNRQIAKEYFYNRIENATQVAGICDILERYQDDYIDFNKDDAKEVYSYVEKFFNKALLIGGKK